MRRNQQYYLDDDVMQNARPTGRRQPARQESNGWSVVVFILMLGAIGLGLAKCG